MTVYVIGDVGIIRDAGDLEDGLLEVIINGVPNDTEITLVKNSGKYSVQSLQNGIAVFEIGDADADYSLSFYNSDGDAIHLYFIVLKGGVIRKLDSMESEFAKLWRAISILADIAKLNENKVSALMDGYATE